MIIKINGIDENIEAKLDLAKLVSSKRLSPDKIVIEHNLRIVPKEEWPSIILQEDDTIEIVSFVGGG